MESHKAATIESLEELLSRNLNVPEYQRPYKWTRNNMADLLDDMETAMHRQSEFPPQRGVSFKYRFGTIILHDAGRCQWVVAMSSLNASVGVR